ncbi:hypothetical protein [Notoacmeibacter ruber]|uniref:Uncharacterized protein n=1 Tax=Notoacmeibacter ruber TaxID=2670375 RepID=A0A3L7J9Q6_9HYPH|nr:hypothetical protein [Notoacmeibacter ruber]RLQ87095.1 hypothetical protein D8780_01570 [Notoacmeibacter ruber]
MFNRRNIMFRAWELRNTVHNGRRWLYCNGVSRELTNGEIFSTCLRQAWAEVRRAAQIASIPAADRQAEIVSLKNEIAALSLKSFRYDIGQTERACRARIAELEAVAA